MLAAGSKTHGIAAWRQYCLLLVLLAAFAVIVWRVVQLQTVQGEHLRAQGYARYLREVVVLPQRGQIVDRNGQVLSVSTPVESIWAEPKRFCAAQAEWPRLLYLLQLDFARLQAACARRQETGKQSEFMYVKRRLPPRVAAQVMALKIPGVEVQREYKRYYPGGTAGAHLIGFTNTDEVGQEGLERHYNAALAGRAGKKRVLKDLHGHYVESVDSIRPVQHGHNLHLSIDQRVQYLADTYLDAAIKQHAAAAGSVVVVAVPSGEILGMVNSPQFNPNDRATVIKGVFRNRTVTDSLEPGSTVKPFTIAMALESGEVGVDTMVDTAPGTYQIGDHTIEDVHNYGRISVFDVLVKSSNVGASKLALALPFKRLYDTFSRLGFGQRSAGLPGEVRGALLERGQRIEHATLAFGYGFAVTPLQLARAYTSLATDGVLLPLTLERQPDGFAATGTRVFRAETVQQIRLMLEQAASATGTASKAVVARYRVGGKTGTTKKLLDGNYDNERYLSLFAGMLPLSQPRFVVVVVVDDPRGGLYYGGDVAAPVFAALAQDLVRLYNLPPDQLPPAADQTTAATPSA